MAGSLKVGDIVLVPQGLRASVRAEVIEIWGDPPTSVRVRYPLEPTEDDPSVVILLSPSVVTAA